MRASPALLLLFGSLAHAEELLPTDVVHDAAATGAFHPFIDSPSSRGSVVKTYGAYDGARDRTSVVLAPVAKVTSWLQLQGKLTYSGGELQREAGAYVNVLQEDDHGADVQVFGGWSGVPFAGAGVGYDLRGTYAIATARVDVGRDEGNPVTLGLGSARTIGMNLYGGVNASLTLGDDLDDMSESSWQLLAGPALSYAASHFTITASGGLAADKPSMGSRELGAFGAVGVGAAF